MKYRFATLPALLPMLALPPAFGQGAPILQPTGLAGYTAGFEFPSISRTMAAFTVLETDQGADRNGDGDQLDSVLHVQDLRSGRVRNLGHANYVEALPAVSDRFVVFAAFEFRDGAHDWNNDGDTSDEVAFLFDRSIGQVRNLGIAVNGRPALTDQVLAFAALETAQGGADLDGDGVVSRCLYVLDPATGVGSIVTPRPSLSSNLEPPFAISGTRVFWRAEATSEIWMRDITTGMSTALGVRSDVAPITRGGLVAIDVPEQLQGQDLNGDGDLLDRRVAVVSSNGNSATILAIDGAQILRASVVIDEHLLLGARYEGGAFGSDLTGDSDSDDYALFVYDDRTGTLTNLQAAGVYGPNSLHKLIGAVDGRSVAFAVSEAGQREDLNSDGDLTDATPVLRILGGLEGTWGLAIDTLAGDPIQISRGQMAFLVSEAAQGQDLDGDGMRTHAVPHVLDPVQWSKPPTNLGLGTRSEWPSSFHFHRGRATFVAQEVLYDLNHDGDLLDDVVVVRGISANSTLDTSLALSHTLNAFRAHDGVIVIGASESDSGHSILNNDGDATDQVMFVLRMNP